MTEPYATAREHDEAVVGWVLGTLECDDEVAFLVHLETCADCRRAVADTTAAMTAVAAAIPQQEPPARLRENIMAAVADEPDPPRRHVNAPTDADVVPFPRRRMRPAQRLAIVAAAVAAVVVIGWLVGVNQSLRQENDFQAADAARSQEVAAVLHDAARPGTAHAVLADPRGGLVGMVVVTSHGPQVMTTGLSDNPGDEVYVLWSLAGPRPQAVGTFDVSGPSPSVRSVGWEGQAGPVAGYAVSLEPGRTAPAAPTRVVASGQVGR